MAHVDAPRLCCYQAVWPPEPVEHTVTAVEALPAPELTVFTGAIDGGIIKWKSTSGSAPNGESDGGGNSSVGGSGMWPSSFLSGHAAMVMVLQQVMAEPARDGTTRASAHELLSADRDGWLCVWDPLSGQCLRRRQLPPSSSCLGGAAALLRDGRHVALVCESPNRVAVQHASRATRHVLRTTASGFPFGRTNDGVPGSTAESLVGLVVVDAWTLAATHRLEPTYSHPMAGAALGMPHAASSPTLPNLAQPAADQAAARSRAAAAAGVSHRVHMTTLRVFSGVPEELEQIAEEHRASYGMSHMLQQQYVMGGWDATWGGMSAEDINALNQGPNSGVDEASRGLLRQSLGVACMVLGVTLDETVYGWQIEDTIIASTQSLEVIASSSLSSQPNPTGLFQWLAWEQGAADSARDGRWLGAEVGAAPLPAVHSEPTLAQPTEQELAGDNEGLARATSFSADGFRLLIVYERGWQLRESEVSWTVGQDIPTYNKLVASGPSPFEMESPGSGRLRAQRMVGGVILATAAPGGRTAARPAPGHSLRRRSAQMAEQGAATHTRADRNASAQSTSVPSSPLARCSMPRASSMRASDNAKPVERILLWSRTGAGVVVRVECDKGGSTVEAELPPDDLPTTGGVGQRPGSALACVRFKQFSVGSGERSVLLRAATARSDHVSYLGAEYRRQDTALALFRFPGQSTRGGRGEGAPERDGCSPLKRGSPRVGTSWLSAAWGGQGCMSRPNIDSAWGAAVGRPSTPPRRNSAPPTVGSASVDRRHGAAAARRLEDSDRGRVTAAALVGGDGMAPELLVHGHASGLISLFPLAAAMLPASPMHGALSLAQAPTPEKGTERFCFAEGSPSTRPLAVLEGHLGRVLCFLEIPSSRLSHTQRRRSGSGRWAGAEVLLLSGGEDGSVHGWLITQGGGPIQRRPALAIHAHTAAVMRLLPPPPGSPRPWDACITSVGADGTVAIISLDTLQIERVLPGHPPGNPTRIAWDPARGFMACLCQCNAGVTSEAAHHIGGGLLASSTDSSRWQSEDGTSPHDHPAGSPDTGDGAEHVSPHTNGHPFKSHRGSINKLRHSIAKRTDKLTSKFGRHKHRAGDTTPSRAASPSSPDHHTTDGSLVAALFDQEKLLVVWDLMTGKRDRVLSGTAADALMQQFERTLATDAPPPASASTSGPIDGGAALSAATGISLLRIDTAQLLRDGSAVELPQAISSAASSSHSGSEPGAAGATPIDRAGELAALALGLGLLHQWGSDPRTDGLLLRLLGSALPSPNSLPPSPGQGAGLRLSGILLARNVLPGWTGAGGGVTLQLPRPVTLPWEAPCGEGGQTSSHFWGDPWLHSAEFVRQRLLVLLALAGRAIQLAGATSEHVCNGASALITFYALRLQDTALPLARPRLSAYAALWDAPNPFLREAARSLLNAAAGPAGGGGGGGGAFLVSPEMEDVVALRSTTRGRQPSAEQLSTHALSIIVAGAACLAHWEQVPDELFRATAPLLFELACHAPAPHASAAASLLSEGFMSSGADRWKAVMGSQLGVFMERILAACELLSQEPSTEASPSTGGDHEAPRIQQRIRHALRVTGGGSTSSPVLTAADRSTRMACREALTAVIPAIAAADLPLFLHTLGQRFAGGVRGDSPTHMLSMISLIRLVHSRPALVAAHLPLVASVIMRGLNPANAALRRTCMQGVSAAVRELTMRFPMAIFHRSESAMLLAVGTGFPGASPHRSAAEPSRSPGLGSGNAPQPAAATSKFMSGIFGGSSREEARDASYEAAREMLSVYDMMTGHKKRILVLPPTNRNPPPGVSAATFSPDGGSVLAFSARDGCLRVWGLSERWTQRLTKASLILAASSEQELLDPKMLPPPVTAAGQVDLAYSLTCSAGGHVMLSHGNTVLGQFDLSSLPAAPRTPASTLF